MLFLLIAVIKKMISNLNEMKVEKEMSFEFPFQPYKIQEDFMKNLYDALENDKVGIFESPTGTVSYHI